MTIRAKKHLGQHFLVDENIARKIVESLSPSVGQLLEIGPGTGVLTKYLIQKTEFELKLTEIDRESVNYLYETFPVLHDKIISGDFLKLELSKIFSGKFAIIGNFPYNISSQIFFKVLEHRDQVSEVVCMIQKEVAQRIASKPGKKGNGILSVLLQAYYNIDYLFTVNEHVFVPPPKVKSAVIKLTRNSTKKLDCDENIFKNIIKQSFNYRRKTLRNSLKSIIMDKEILANEIYDRRPETLSIEEFVSITKTLEQIRSFDAKDIEE